jgi:hypothetical protein
MKYRIKKIQYNDGTYQYVPQVKKKWYHLFWLNLTFTHFGIEESLVLESIYENEKLANRVIVKHHAEILFRISKQVKSITYKMK